jgi:DNA-binding winged helix-turn-helix (wHTH) protein
MRLAFGDCVFDSGTREVFLGGRLVPVSPKAFQFLEILIGRRPNAVSKEELHTLLWPTTFVSDANLPNIVAELRTGLGDDAREPHIIRTVPRFGYAFVAPERAPQKVGPHPDRVYRLIWGTREIALATGENLFGRDEDAVVWIDDALVSRRHARIVIDETGAVLEDLGSKNGTYLRGKRITAPSKLADEDLLTIGPASMVFRAFKEIASTASAKEGSRRG